MPNLLYNLWNFITSFFSKKTKQKATTAARIAYKQEKEEPPISRQEDKPYNYKGISFVFNRNQAAQNRKIRNRCRAKIQRASRRYNSVLS